MPIQETILEEFSNEWLQVFELAWIFYPNTAIILAALG